MSKKQPQITVQNCNFQSEAFKFSPEVLSAVEALAHAAQTNAAAIKAIAEHMTGPAPTGSMLSFVNGEER